MGWRAKVITGLDIGHSAIKMIQLKQTDKGIEIVNCGKKEIPSELRGKREENARLIKELFAENGVRTKEVFVTIPRQDVIVRNIDVPPVEDSLLRQAVLFELEKQIPYTVEEIEFDYTILKRDEKIQLFVVVAKKDIIDAYGELLKDVGVKAGRIDLSSFTLQNLFYFNQEYSNAGETVLLVEIGDSKTELCILQDATLRLSRSITTAGSTFTAAVNKVEGGSVEEAESKKKTLKADDGLLIPASYELLSEIKGSIDYYNTLPNTRKVEKIVLCGGGALLAGLDNLLKQKLKVKVEVINPFRRLLHHLDYQLAPFLSCAIGAALTGLQVKQTGINLISSRTDNEVDTSGFNYRQMAVAGALIFVFAMSSFQLNLKTKQKELAYLNQQLTILEPRVEYLDDNILAYRKLQTQTDRLKKLSTFNRNYLDVLRDLNLRFPGYSWVDSISIEGDELTELRGKTPSATQLMKILEKSPFLSNLEFSGPITIETETGKNLEEFKITGKVRDTGRR